MGSTGSSPSPKHSQGSRSALPVVIINTRHVPSDNRALESYNIAHLAASNYMMNNIRGTKAAFQSTDVDDQTLVHDVQWFDSLESFMLHVDMDNKEMQKILSAWIPKYDLSVPFTGHVFGGWNEDVKKITVEVGGADFMMVPRSTGYIKQTGDGIDGPPIIVYNHRKVLPGKMEALLDAHQAYSDYMYEHVPGVIALTAGVDDQDPLLLHDLQVFANFEVFLGHADLENPVVKKLFTDWINFDLYDSKHPFNGEVWAPADKVDKIKKITMELGGAVFNVYPMEEIQGSVDLNNWE